VGNVLSFEPGAVAWIDLEATAGTTAASTFYCRLFGWRVLARHRPLDDHTGYWAFRQDGGDIGGVMPGHEPVWSMYVSVRDIVATARTVTEHGGSIVVHPSPVFDAGIMAACADPLGARFNLWQPLAETGFDVTGKPNSFTWAELSSPDAAVAERFYNAVLGWEAKSDGSAHTEFRLPGAAESMAGMVETGAGAGTGRPSAWSIFFAVADTDATAARAATLGGSVVTEPHDHPTVGRVAVLKDPSATPFAILERPAP
jgi:hypothetical protein